MEHRNGTQNDRKSSFHSDYWEVYTNEVPLRNEGSITEPVLILRNCESVFVLIFEKSDNFSTCEQIEAAFLLEKRW